MDDRRQRELVVFRAAGLAPEEGAPVILPGRMPGDSSRYANGMPDGWGVGDERPSDEYIACHIALDALQNGNHVSWTAPRQDLLAFRVLVERGRARARDALLGRVFGLPKELFCVVVSFWRTSRDAPDDFDDCPPFCAPTFRE